MYYERKYPLDYVDIAENLREPSWFDVEEPDATLLPDGATAIMELLKYKDAIDRMGKFGCLFVDYHGCPRGPVGRAGGISLKEDAMLMDVITDVDGGRWRPVNEDILQDLFAHAEAAEARCKRLDEARENANEAAAKWEGLYRMALERAEKAEMELCRYVCGLSY